MKRGGGEECGDDECCAESCGGGACCAATFDASPMRALFAEASSPAGAGGLE